LLGLDVVSNRARLVKNCRLEKGGVSTGVKLVKKIVLESRLEIMPILCFDGVAAISNRGLRY
jgi:hypothetical protein